jgi:hypothetical protein
MEPITPSVPHPPATVIPAATNTSTGIYPATSPVTPHEPHVMPIGDMTPPVTPHATVATPPAHKGLEDFIGKVLFSDDQLITVTTNGAHHSRTINGNTKFSVEGKDEKLADLKVGDTVTLVGDPVTSITKKTK